MLNLDSTWSQLSFEVYNMHIAQNLNFWISRQFLTPKISNFQILSYRNVMYLKRKLRTCRIQIQEEKVGFIWKNWIFFHFCEFRVKIPLEDYNLSFPPILTKFAPEVYFCISWKPMGSDFGKVAKKVPFLAQNCQKVPESGNSLVLGLKSGNSCWKYVFVFPDSLRG